MSDRITLTDVNIVFYDKDNGILVYEPIIPVLNDAEIVDENVQHAKLVEGCKINEIHYPEIKKFAGVMRKFYSDTPLNTIRDNTTFNITTEKRNTDGYRYHPALGFSYQSKNTKGTLREIIQMCRVKNYSLEMKIQLKDGRIVLFRM